VIPDAAIRSLRAAVGERNCFSEPEELRTYECDGLTSFKATPGVVVLPGSTEQVAEVVKIARAHGLPVVPRGAGTGLSGGALPVPGCVLVGLSRMKRVLQVDLDNAWMRVEPGVVNLDVSRKLAPQGYYYAPDPSSQSVCTIGGNVAENSGGAHCLKYGFTVNHVLGARVVLGDGSIADLGGPVLDAPGYDLTGALVGSEGTLGIVTEVVLRILRKPEATRTFFATFPSTDEAGNAVSRIIAAGIVPAAIEMMDRLAIVAIKAATGVDWPDVGAALLMDVDGCAAEVEHTAQEAVRIAEQAGALMVRVPRDEAERQTMWKGRKSAFAAVGRISPNYMVQDGSSRDRSSPRCCARSKSCVRRRASAWRTSFTRATGTCTRSSSTTRASPGRKSWPRRSAGKSCAPASAWAGPSPASTASARTRRPTWASCSARRTSPPWRSSAARSIRKGG